MLKKSNVELKIPLVYITLMFLLFAAINMTNRYHLFILIAFGILCLNVRRKFIIEVSSLILLGVLGISWLLFSTSSASSLMDVIKPFIYLLCSIIGASLLDDDSEYSTDKTPFKLFYMTVFVLALGTLVHYTLNWRANLDAVDRNTIDVWTNSVMSATGQAVLACLPLGFATACLFSKKSRPVKIFSIVAIVIILAYNLILAGRTLLVMLLVVMALALLHYTYQHKKGRMKLLLIVLAVILLVLFLYQKDCFGIRSLVEDSTLYDRVFGEDVINRFEDARSDRKIYYLKNMDKSLFGGGHIRSEFGHAHDLFLDTYDEAGIFAFFAIVGYILISLSHFIKALRDKTLPFEFRQMVLCIYVVVYIQFCIEPILLGVPWLFAYFCLIDGYVYRIITHNRICRSKI